MYQLKQFINKLTKIDYIFIVVLMFTAMWYLTNLNGTLDHDEVRYAQTGYIALTTGELVDLGVSNHPPLIKYFFGISQIIFGVNSFAIRFSSAIFGLGILILVYLIGKTWSPFVGLCSSIMLIFTIAFSSKMVIALLDAGLTFFIVLLLFIFIKFKTHKYFYLYLGVSSGLIMMSKLTGIYILIPTILFILYLTLKEKNIKNLVLYFIGFFVIIFVIYMPYILQDVRLLSDTILFTGSLENRSSPNENLLIGLKEFINNSNFYNPLYAVGLIISPLFFLFSKKYDEKFIAILILFYYIGIHISINVAPRFILPMLPIISLMFFISIYKILQTVVPSSNIHNSERCLFSFFIILIVLFSPPLKLSPDSVSLQPIYKDSDIYSIIEIISNLNTENNTNSTNKKLIDNIVVASTRQPILLYYLGAPPETYVNSIQSPNPPPSIYNYTIQVNNTKITLLWFGIDRNTDLEILNLVKKGNVDIIISHKPSLKKRSLNIKIFSYAKRYEKTEPKNLRGTKYEVYWMK